MVDAADVLHHPLLAIARQVAGAVQAFAGTAIRVGHKALGRHGRPAEITASQTDATNQQFTGHRQRARRKRVVEDKQRRIGNRSPYKRHRLKQRIGGRPDGRLGRPVQVPHRALTGEHALSQVGGQRLTTTQAFDSAQYGATFAVQQHAPGRWRGLQHVDGCVLHQVEDGLRVQGRVLVGQDHRRAHRQGNVKLQGKNIEREGGQRQQACLCINAQGVGHALGEAAQRGMAHHHALGFAGGAGRVDHICQVLTTEFDVWVDAAVAPIRVFVHQ